MSIQRYDKKAKYDTVTYEIAPESDSPVLSDPNKFDEQVTLKPGRIRSYKNYDETISGYFVMPYANNDGSGRLYISEDGDIFAAKDGVAYDNMLGAKLSDEKKAALIKPIEDETGYDFDVIVHTAGIAGERTRQDTGLYSENLCYPEADKDLFTKTNPTAYKADNTALGAQHEDSLRADLSVTEAVLGTSYVTQSVYRDPIRRVKSESMTGSGEHRTLIKNDYKLSSFSEFSENDETVVTKDDKAQSVVKNRDYDYVYDDLMQLSEPEQDGSDGLDDSGLGE